MQTVFEANKPEIVVELRLATSHHNKYQNFEQHLCVANVGSGTARKVEFEGDFSFQPMYGKPLNEINFLQNGIETLRPGETEIYKLAGFSGPLDKVFSNIANEHRNSEVTISVTYRNFEGQEIEDSFLIDFRKAKDPYNYV